MAGARIHVVMPQELVERIDAACPEGVSRGEFVRRAVEHRLAMEFPSGVGVPVEYHSAPSESVAAERALSEAQGPLIATQADSGPVSSSEDVRSAAPAEQPGPLEQRSARVPVKDEVTGSNPVGTAKPYRRQPGPDVRNIRSSQQARRNVRPIPKGKR